jgi:hypothetical protein
MNCPDPVRLTLASALDRREMVGKEQIAASVTVTFAIS